MRRFASAVFFVLVASNVSAQRSAFRSGLSLGIRLPVGLTSRAQICDGSEIESSNSRRSLGKALSYGGLGAIVIAPLALQGKAVPLIEVGAVALVGGAALRHYSNPSEDFWQRSVSQIKVGQTTSREVRECFRTPSTATTTGMDETWTYAAQQAGFLGIGGKTRTLTVSFRDGVARSVSRTDAAVDR